MNFSIPNRRETGGKSYETKKRRKKEKTLKRGKRKKPCRRLPARWSLARCTEKDITGFFENSLVIRLFRAFYCLLLVLAIVCVLQCPFSLKMHFLSCFFNGDCLLQIGFFHKNFRYLYGQKNGIVDTFEIQRELSLRFVRELRSRFLIFVYGSIFPSIVLKNLQRLNDVMSKTPAAFHQKFHPGKMLSIPL